MFVHYDIGILKLRLLNEIKSLHCKHISQHLFFTQTSSLACCCRFSLKYIVTCISQHELAICEQYELDIRHCLLVVIEYYGETLVDTPVTIADNILSILDISRSKSLISTN